MHGSATTQFESVDAVIEVISSRRLVVISSRRLEVISSRRLVVISSRRLVNFDQ